ncbi:MAG: hypothetical protein CL912_04780 [Deltaproteobacteria bacterium]|nr:hypothetical protein [Deltaproteobacteria bacterium]
MAGWLDGWMAGWLDGWSVGLIRDWIGWVCASRWISGQQSKQAGGVGLQNGYNTILSCVERLTMSLLIEDSGLWGTVRVECHNAHQKRKHHTKRYATTHLKFRDCVRWGRGV